MIYQLNLTFREVIYNYRRQPQCKPQVFCGVFIDWSSTSCNGRTEQEHVDIITFYNEIFIPSVKALLVELGAGGTATKANRICEASNNNDGFVVPKESQNKVAGFTFHGEPAQLRHGDVVIAAITSCTNTSNPSVMLGAALVAKKA
ncbi:hypothetical protein K1719_026523 [Acacia pycnantha]|nr:hypothetical protein K1719_026523 [Acacia pycnantha]